ncbi:hypothetical protein BH10PAT4_BH10PAT4_4090 [soil metagenome]
MRLLETAPQIPYSQGHLVTQESGDESATSIVSESISYNAIRRQGLTRTNGRDVADIDSAQFSRSLVDDKSNVIFVFREKSDGPDVDMVAGAMARRKKVGSATRRIIVQEMAVDENFRAMGIASYMLGRLTLAKMTGREPTEIAIDTKFALADGLNEKLTHIGFRHVTKKGQPAMWLPGTLNATSGRSDPTGTSLDVYKERTVKYSPEHWTGYHKFGKDRTANDFLVIRNGLQVGSLQSDEESRVVDFNYGELKSYVLSDPGGVELDTLKAVTEKEAVIALLNNYELLK